MDVNISQHANRNARLPNEYVGKIDPRGVAISWLFW